MKRCCRILLISGFFALAIVPVLTGQSTDTTAVQAPPPEPVPAKSRYIPNPRKSLILSLSVPGGGQINNRRWWKLPFVYGALGGMVYAISYNQSNYRDFREALELKLQNEPHQFSNTNLDSSNALRTLRDRFDKNTQLSYIGTFIVYVAIAAEAFVDAHLLDFDIDDSLELEITPLLHPAPDQAGTSAGISVKVRF